MIFAMFALGFIPRDKDIADYTVKIQTYRSTPLSIFQSDRVMWIEIWKDDCRDGVILARMLYNTRQNAPEASLLGVRITEDTYRHL
eukprot:5648385-Pleurochrysis_carterae.AAC.1